MLPKQLFEDVPPFFVGLLNQIDFPSSAPLFKALFPSDSVRHRLVKLNINKPMDVVFPAEAFDNTGFVLPDSTKDVAGNTDIKRAIPFAGQNIDAGSFHRPTSYQLSRLLDARLRGHDGVDGPCSPASKCHKVVVSERHIEGAVRHER